LSPNQKLFSSLLPCSFCWLNKLMSAASRNFGLFIFVLPRQVLTLVALAQCDQIGWHFVVWPHFPTFGHIFCWKISPNAFGRYCFFIKKSPKIPLYVKAPCFGYFLSFNSQILVSNFSGWG
jgi:hypothetical protein